MCVLGAKLYGYPHQELPLTHTHVCMYIRSFRNVLAIFLVTCLLELMRQNSGEDICHKMLNSESRTITAICRSSELPWFHYEFLNSFAGE